MPVLKFEPGHRASVCHVRLRHERPDGFVEFDFSLGDPDLSVDLIMPKPAYTEFCRDNNVRFITAEQGRQIDDEQAKWRYGRPVTSD